MKTLIRIWAVALLGGLLLPLSGIQAQTANMDVTATVQGTCTIGVGGDVAFGTLVPLTGPQGAASTIDWACSQDTAATVTIDDGVNGTRNMLDVGVTASGDTIAYDLFHTAGAPPTNRWGTSAAEDLDVLGSGLAIPTVENVYGWVLEGDYSGETPSIYRDTVTVTITIVP